MTVRKQTEQITVVAVMLFGLMLPALAQEKMDTGALVRQAMKTGKPATAMLSGGAEEYLRSTLKTDKAIWATATIVKRLDPTCVRARIVFEIPDLVVTATNPKDPTDKRTGPFESTMEGNFCDNG